MEQARFWMWAKTKADPIPRAAPPAMAPYGDSWEEQAFAEDAAAGSLGGCVWPPRSYSCSFCRREFKSAQALGGHMNVHRRDRARLKQSPTDHHHHQLVVPQSPPNYTTFLYNNPNPNLSHTTTPPSWSSFLSNDKKKRAEKEDCVTELDAPRSLSMVLLFNEQTQTKASSEEEEEVASCKRRRIEAKPSPEYLSVGQSEVIKVVCPAGEEEEVDLELRLGNASSQGDQVNV